MVSGPEFLSVAVWVWEFLVLGLLPLFSVTMAAIFIYKIGKAGQLTASKMGGQLGKMFKLRR